MSGKHVHRPDVIPSVPIRRWRSFCVSCGKRIQRIEASDKRREYWRLAR